MRLGQKVKIIAGAATGDVVEITKVRDDGNLELRMPSGIELLYMPSEVELVEQVPPFGLTSAKLAEYVAEFITRCSTRVVGVGDEQYSEGDQQKFETMNLRELLTWALEEVEDVGVYAAMMEIRLLRIRDEFDAQVAKEKAEAQRQADQAKELYFGGQS